MDISITNLQKKIPISPNRIIKAAAKILRHEGIFHASLSIVFVDDKAIKTLNKNYLKKNYPTDVLAFDLREDFVDPPKARRRSLRPRKIQDVDGEIIISAQTALRNSRAYHAPFPGELILYLTHGILHLLGYDDHQPKDIRRIRQREKEILNFLNQ